jgi:hypothetical protein
LVHPKFHDRYCTIDGFLEYPPKNVGIRRAFGDYILSTNSDVVLSPEVCEKMLHGDLDREKVYRASRMDIEMSYTDVKFPVPDQYCLEVNHGLTNASGDFLFMHKDMWGLVTGYCEEFPAQRLHKDSLILHQLVTLEGYEWEDMGIITHWRHPSSWSSKYIDRGKVGDIHWDITTCGYKRNKPTWGLTFAREQERNGVTWLV